MKKAIYYRLITLIFISISIYGLISASIALANNQTQIENWLSNVTRAVAELYVYDSDIDLLSHAAGNNRVTIIDPDGYVLADSYIDTTTRENRADREEFIHANADDVFILIRTSYTLGEQFMYATILMADGHVLRIAYSYPGLIYNFFVQLPAMLAATLIAFSLSALLAGKFTKTVTTPLEIVMNALENREYTQLRDYESPYPEVNNIMQGVEPLLQQISESRHSLRIEQEKINHVLSNMEEGFILIDHNENILLCNHSVKAFLNCNEDVISQNLITLINDKSVNIAVERALEKEQSSMFELWIREDLILNVYVSPTGKDSSHTNETGATLLFVDTTNEKQLEKQKRDFFSNASHELKTPITSILGFAEMINQNIIQTEAEKEEVLRRIETEARRMSELINNLLVVSKLESNHLPPEFTDFNLNEVVQEAVDSVSPINHHEPVHIEFSGTDVMVYANKRQLYEMCVNVIENAVKYNKPGGKVQVELKAKKYEVTLRVKDTGIGIPLEHQTRVFERFFRVDYGRDKKVGGSGLGLSIVKHIVSLYNGEISLRSKKDVGTTIKITLPIVRRSS
ncbi:MAG: ATP-binding protein [Turicibacter sp.]|nr:ATP-binding protein [Turicibacter sp.]